MAFVLNTPDGSHLVKYLRVRAKHLLQFSGLSDVPDIGAEYAVFASVVLAICDYF